MQQVGNFDDFLNDHVCDVNQKIAEADTQRARNHTDYRSFGNEQVAYVEFPCADTSQNADFLAPFKDRNIGYYAYHYRRNDKRHRRKRDKRGDHGVGHFFDVAHNRLQHVGVFDGVVFVLFAGVHPCVRAVVVAFSDVILIIVKDF